MSIKIVDNNIQYNENGIEYYRLRGPAIVYNIGEVMFSKVKNRPLCIYTSLYYYARCGGPSEITPYFIRYSKSNNLIYLRSDFIEFANRSYSANIYQN